MALFLTHAQPRVQGIIAALAIHNIEGHALSFQQVVQSDNQAQACRDQRGRIDLYDHVIFVSPNAVDAFFQANVHVKTVDHTAVNHAASQHAAAQHAGASIAGEFNASQWLAVGPGSQAAIEHWLGRPLMATKIQTTAYPADSIAQAFDADGLLEQIDDLLAARAKQQSQHRQQPPLKVLVVKGAIGRTDWIAALQAKGVIVDELQAYSLIDCAPSPSVVTALAQHRQAGGHVAIVLTSVANVQRLTGWAQSLEPADCLYWLQNQLVCGIHPRIVARLRAASFVHTKEIMPGLDGLRAAALK